MCSKLPYCNPRRDKCIVSLLNYINNNSDYTTLASCCDHGVYKMSIVVKDKGGKIMDLISRVPIATKKRKRYYKTDLLKNYYVPEVVDK